MTTTTLSEYTLKDLAKMAKKRGISGWHSMRKSDLIRALVRDEKQALKNGSSKGRVGAGSSSKTVAVKGRAAAKAGGKATSSRRKAATSRRESTRSTSVDSGTVAKASVRQTASRRTTSATSRSTVGSRSTNGSKSTIARPGRNGTSGKLAAAPQRLSPVARKIQKAHQEVEHFKDLSGIGSLPAGGRRLVNSVADRSLTDASGNRDRVVLMVRDPYWLHVHWEVSSRSIQRAQAAMAEYWHTAKPVIRLMEVPVKGTTSSTETLLRDIEIHGGVNNWYIDVLDPPRGHRVEIGYLGSNGRFHGLARSNSVVTPEPGARDALDGTWVDVAANCERIFALSGGYSAEGSTDELQEVLEERLCRPVGSPMMTRFGVGADPSQRRDHRFKLEVEAEMIVHGTTRPGAHVTLAGEPIKLRDDGSFSVRMSLPDRRQVLPVTSSSQDGVMQQTVVLAVERNTKVMEAVLRDNND